MEASSSSKAPEHPLPSAHFFSIEYPGYVRPASVPLAITHLGGQASLDTVFKRTATKADALLELSFRPDNPFAHPVPGDVVGTSNILLKIVKRKRKAANGELVGEYTAEAAGAITKTVRFRSMVDYQYQADMSDPVAKLRVAMGNMDVDAIQQYRMPEATEDYTIPADPVLDPQLVQDSTAPSAAAPQNWAPRSNLRLFPPPLFSRQGIPQNYNFKANIASMVSTTVDEVTGEEHKRLVNRWRWKGFGPANILFADAAVPSEPPPNVAAMREQMDQALLKRVEALFEERFVWTRASIFNQFTPLEARDIHNSKVLLPLVCYVFQDGPWRDTLIRFGYDPRRDPGARVFQRLYFRNMSHPIERVSIITRREGHAAADTARDGGAGDVDRKTAHIFDGVRLTQETAAFQLCDIHDPMLREMIKSEEDVREVCDEREGWYSTDAYEQIKVVLRHKFFSLLEGHIPPQEECEALLQSHIESKAKSGRPVPPPVVGRKRPSRVGKNNMAKGALRPEDAAAARLQATLERNAKDLKALRSGK
ncbi:hypothetical protein FIBSPDRAFT_1042044 [Athelia psychrophila]|uniref:Transcription factor IIIC subunit 5 HTH domain-containing protein n=1 Tax=Athelia psychrophila TaxID=1759441 RepID=A0A166N2G0_9AGAM|nr:hypothetical protein FIBSPDRAFT_1042044 [Fibularhizoctonia sp. CBS 109695]